MSRPGRLALLLAAAALAGALWAPLAPSQDGPEPVWATCEDIESSERDGFEAPPAGTSHLPLRMTEGPGLRPPYSLPVASTCNDGLFAVLLI